AVDTTNSDYDPTSGTLTWADGDTADKTFTVAITNDSFDEPDENVNLVLISPTGGATLGGQGAAALNIIDDDLQPDLSVSDVSLVEGDNGQANFVFDVTLSTA